MSGIFVNKETTFTKIPVDLAIKVAKERLRNDASLGQRTSLPVEDIVELLSFCLNTTYFVFEGTYYQQVFGTAMGSPVSAVIANLVMEDVEQRALASAPVNPSFWKRFVDDEISAVSENEIDVLLQHLNSIEPSIQFTVERETGRKLAFLDTCVHRTIEGKLETDVYRKPTHTDKYLSFNSHHPRSHKKSVATTLLQRAESLTSNSVARDSERQYVINVLKENNYPKNFLYDCLRRSALTNCDSSAGNSAMKGFAIVPYIQGIAEPIMRILNNCGIKVALKPIQTLGHIFAKTKDRVPTDRKTHAVYSIPCGDCEKEYLGQTKRQFCTRLKEHQRAVSNLYSSSQPWLNMCAKQAIKLRWKIQNSLPQTIVMVNDFVWKPGILTLALVPLIGMTVAICNKNICILLANDVMLSSI